jgi:hypothetical protein
MISRVNVELKTKVSVTRKISETLIFNLTLTQLITGEDFSTCIALFTDKITIARNCAYNSTCSLKVTTACAKILFQKGKWDFKDTHDLYVLIMNSTISILSCWEIIA